MEGILCPCKTRFRGAEKHTEKQENKSVNELLFSCRKKIEEK